MSLIDAFCTTHWAMEPVIFDQLRAIVERHADGIKLPKEDIRAAIGRAPGTPNPRNRKYDVHAGVALVPIQGVISKHSADVGDISQPQGVSSEDIQNNLRTAVADPEVTAILLCIESPGGAVDGTQAAADAVRAAAGKKTVWAFIDGLGASAAYWIACGASRIYATSTATVGSIGIITAMRDTSKADEKAGYRTIVIRSGPNKAIGQRGEAITDEMVKPMQDHVNGLAQAFFAHVGTARGLSGEALDAVTDGRVFLPSAAKVLGLIDAIGSLDDVLADISNPSKRRMVQPMVPTTSKASAQTGASLPTLAGVWPAPKGSPMPKEMKISGEGLNALIQKHGEHAKMIMAMASGADGKEPATEAEITSALKDASVTSMSLKVGELTSQLKTANDALTAAQASHAAAILAKDEKITALTAEVAEKATAIKNLSAGNKPLNADPIKPPESAKAAYEARAAALRKEGVKDPHAHIAKNEPDLHKQYLDEHNAKTQKGAAK